MWSVCVNAWHQTVCSSEAPSLLSYLSVGVDWFSFRVSSMYNECISPEQSLLSVYTHSARTAYPTHCSSCALSAFCCSYIYSLPSHSASLTSLHRRETVKAAAASNITFSLGKKQRMVKGIKEQKEDSAF